LIHFLFSTRQDPCWSRIAWKTDLIDNWQLSFKSNQFRSCRAVKKSLYNEFLFCFVAAATKFTFFLFKTSFFTFSQRPFHCSFVCRQVKQSYEINFMLNSIFWVFLFDWPFSALFAEPVFVKIHLHVRFWSAFSGRVK
jgi:hypothetical protein